jgi:hypothetical protein
MESVLLGLAFVNSVYLAIWVLSAFGLLRNFAGLVSYVISSIIASTGCLTVC